MQTEIVIEGLTQALVLPNRLLVVLVWKQPTDYEQPLPVARYLREQKRSLQ